MLNDINKIAENLTKLDYDFALAFITTNFKGNHKKYLTQYLNNEISLEKLKYNWYQLDLSGDFLADLKLEELSVIDKLKFIAYFLDSFNISCDTLKENSYKGVSHKKEDLVKGFTLLLNDLVNKDNLRIRNKDAQIALLSKLEKEPLNSSDQFQEQCSLIPHEPEDVEEVIEPEVINTDENEEEIADLTALTI